MNSGSFARWTRRHPDDGLGLRLFLGCLAVFLLAVPFTVLLVLVEAHWVPLRHLDDAATRDSGGYVHDHPALVGPLRASAYFLHPWVFRVTVLLLAIRLAVRGRRRLAVWTVVTIAVAGAAGSGLKALTDRPRPVLPAPIAHAPGTSFPSGHALTATVGGAVIVVLLLPVLRGAWRVVAWAAAVMVSLVAGACRVLLGVHYVSDVVAGWILGAAIVLATVAAFATWRHNGGEHEHAGRTALPRRTESPPR